MVSVMNNDFDLERNPSSVPVDEEGPRVSNVVDSREDGRVGDLNLKEETRVSTGIDMGAQESEMDEIRVSPGPGQEGDDSRVLDVDSHHNVNGVSSGNDVVHGDGEIELRVQDDKSVDDENEGVTDKVGVIGTSDDQIRGLGALGSPSASDSDALGDDAIRKKGFDNSEDLVVDAKNDEFRLERRGNLQASVHSDVGASNADGVVTVGSMKIFGSEFEMGDMVWGKVKSHPWWPGHIYNEAFATSSVRRSRRDGHVLVAFFGDSSYGWFDLTELIPYEPNYAEKSQQTNSRNFMNAVEESVDEASRRSALGLSCMCRSSHNFRPAKVPGYMVVDVVDYEPGAIYSVSQIQKARERFRPAETLSFIKQLAASPVNSESKSLDLITHKAAALAYRRYIFEKFDETYAEAFGQQPVRPSESPTPKEPSRAPLSGPLVMAEALGGRKSSSKGTKPKELSKKDKYLFKRRDEAGNLRNTQKSQAHGSSSSPSAYQQGTSDSPAASYVFQKRDQIVSIKDESSGAPPLDTKDISNEGLDAVASPVSVKRVSPAPASGGPEQSESSIPDNRFGGVNDNDGGHIGVSGGLVKKRKKKAAKHPAGELSSEKPDISEKKMKKKLRKTEVHSETVPSRSGGLIKPEGKPMKLAVSSRERKDFEASDSVSQQVGLGPPGFVEGNGDELPELLADLLGLALNPFHGVERNRPAIIRHFFLKFRGLVFLKSSSASPPPPESETSEVRGIRSPPPSDRTPTDSRKTLPSSLKKSKLSVRHDDPTKGGRKRVPSERQEDIAAKRAKKITDVKLLAAEKKAAALLKNPNPEQPPPFSRLTKTEQQSKKKSDRQLRVEEPTYVVMKFQSGSSLPSLMELKARFARFGPLDTSLSRVFYKTNTCRVAFLYKQDANKAYRYANANLSNVKCLMKPVAETQPQQPPGSGRADESLPGDSLSNRDSSTVEPRPLLPQQPGQQLKSCLKKPSGSDEPGVGPTNGSGSVKMARVRFNMSEDKAGASNNQRTGVQAQMADSRNAKLSSEIGPSSSSSSASVAMDSVSNNQRFISLNPLQPPLLPTPPPQFLRPPPSINLPRPPHFEVPPRNNLNYNMRGPPGQASPPLPPPPLPPPPPPSIDISQQMMSLLTRCHDVVTNLKSALGHVPYHPL